MTLMLVRLKTSEPIAFFIYLLLLFITLTVSQYHSDEDEAPPEDDSAVEDLQSGFDDPDDEALAGNKEDEEPSMFGICWQCPGRSARSSLTMSIQSLAGR